MKTVINHLTGMGYIFLVISYGRAQDSCQLLRTINTHHLSADACASCLKTLSAALNIGKSFPSYQGVMMIICLLFAVFGGLVLNAAEAMDKYSRLLDNPQIAGAMIWEDETGIYAWPDWTEQQKADLNRHLNDLEAGAEFPISGPPELHEDKTFSKADAWLIYLTHAAHSLWLDANEKVAWRLESFTQDQIALLLDSRKLITFEKEDHYYFDVYNGMGRITDWNIAFSYEFMRARDFILPDQRSTAMAFASWCRTYLLHIPGRYDSPDGYETLYGYRGYPPVDRILSPLEDTYGHISAGCWGTTGLFNAVMRSVNIPVSQGYGLFALPESRPSAHSRIELPSIGIGLCHSDDLYSMVCKPTGAVISTDSLFQPISWLETHIAQPAVLDSAEHKANDKYEQALYNAHKFLLKRAVSVLSDYILYQRAQDDSENDAAVRLNSTLTGPAAGGETVQYAMPYFSESERQEILSRTDEALKALGSGVWSAGTAVVRARYPGTYAKDDRTTKVGENARTFSQSIHLFQNYPNPFNPETTLLYETTHPVLIRLSIMDMLGREIIVLVSERKHAGLHRVMWDGRNRSGKPAAGGIYLAVLQTGNARIARKILLIK
jgi:hypothetical protein